MNGGQSLEDLTALQVAQIMRRIAGLEMEAIAVAMGRNRQTVGCWFGEAAADKFVPLPLAPQLCHVLGSPLLLEWMVAQYERCLRDDPPQQWRGSTARTTDLLLRGLVQAGNALELLRDLGGSLSPSQGRQVSEATLLAVASLAAAAREARGEWPGAGRNLRFDRDGEADYPAPRQSWWRRMAARWRRDPEA